MLLLGDWISLGFGNEWGPLEICGERSLAKILLLPPLILWGIILHWQQCGLENLMGFSTSDPCDLMACVKRLGFRLVPSGSLNTSLFTVGLIAGTNSLLTETMEIEFPTHPGADVGALLRVREGDLHRLGFSCSEDEQRT